MAASLKLPHKCITDPAAAAANVHTAYIQAQLEQTYKHTYDIPNIQRQLYTSSKCVDANLFGKISAKEPFATLPGKTMSKVQTAS